jgi:hypothetical protein
VVANFDRWVPHRGVFQPMNNEENFPVVVWALARKPVE